MKSTFYFLLAALVLMAGCRKPPPPSPPQKRKPIIYLYPTETMQVRVDLDFKGKLTTTYPKYQSAKGWTVTASPDGTLSYDGKEFYALFWEGNGKVESNPQTGFVVKGEQTSAFLEEKLELLGLNAKERNEFMVYWLPQMQGNAYNFIHFAGSSYTDQAPLRISPAPETLIRVFMEFRALDAPIDVEAQTLTPVQRKGFTVVEWGGEELRKGNFVVE